MRTLRAVETGAGVLEVPETAQHETGADEKDDGESHLDGDQRGTGEAAAGVGVEASEALLERLVHVAPDQAEGGQESGERPVRTESPRVNHSTDWLRPMSPMRGSLSAKNLRRSSMPK